MESKSSEILIVGGSITGGVAARESAKKGFKTTLIEEHSYVGKQGKCTALVSTSGLKKIGLKYENAVMNEIYGAVIHSKHFNFSVVKKTPVAVVLDRQKLDEEAIAEAEAEGAKIKLRTKLEKINEANIQTNRQTIEFNWLVGADGFSSTTAKTAGFPEIKEKVLCYEAEFKGRNDEKMVHVYLDSEAYPGFFGWIVPAGSETKTGFGTTEIKKIRELQGKFLQRSEIKKFKNLKKQFHAFIPMQERERIQKNNILLIGDAAGQTKPTTGGGIVFGSLGAITAIEKLENYEKEWMKEKTLKKHLLVRKILDKMDNNFTDAAILSSNLGFNKILEKIGDMDFIFK